jgi:hypothetical protein
LLRQTDPNWEAIFFITDDKPFDARLKEILNQFNDPRVSFFDIPMEFRPAVRFFLLVLLQVLIFFFSLVFKLGCWLYSN